MEKAAKDLKVNLVTLYDSHDNNFREQPDKVRYIRQLQQKPDFVILTPLPVQVSLNTLQALEALKIHSFIISGEIPPAEKMLYQQPQQKFKYWFGHMYGNNKAAGYLLAQHLHNENVNMMALAGSNMHSESENRVDGLRNYVAEHNIILSQIVPTDWTEQQGYYKTSKLLNRYKNTNAIWTAGHRLASGAIKAVAEAKLSAGPKIGTFNWTEETLAQLSAERLKVAVGGHSITGALALVLLHDAYYKHDFTDINGTREIPLTLVAATPENLDETILHFKHWAEFNFQNISKVYNKSLRTHYINVLPPQTP
ncbi:substrate-binding domain-containing protein (plasmid) [Catenovulum sp. SX2]|uniref:substrate-binding domain-containing protein n=1 Tax=Catenovulum sp. SX2 TaxID=3398614 RepID=UPI003F879FEB